MNDPTVLLLKMNKTLKLERRNFDSQIENIFMRDFWHNKSNVSPKPTKIRYPILLLLFRQSVLLILVFDKIVQNE